VKVAILIASRNRPDLVEAQVTALRADTSVPHDIYVVECGTDRERLSEHSTLWYADPEFRGKCFGHALALQSAKLAQRYDYYFVLMNDVVFEPGVDAVRTLVEQMEREPRMAILSPCNQDGGYPGSARQGSRGWRPVATCDYLGFMMRAAAEDEVGFLDARFEYCWGAIHELAYKLYRSGWFVAYSDEVAYRHLGGSTYGQAQTNTISREEYQHRAKRFAFEYFRRTYGDNWDETFFAATRAHAIQIDTFAEHKRLWSTAFSRVELQEMGCAVDARSTTRPAEEPRAADPSGVKLHLGCGKERRDGWINVDSNPALAPDVVAHAGRLPMFDDQSVDVVEANHLFEHLTLDEAHAALDEWARILKPGGELILELPDFDACVRVLGKYRDDAGYDMGLIGIYGWPPLIADEGAHQLHKWGWNRERLSAALRAAGFARVEVEPIRQTWRAAAKIGTLMRVRASRAAASVAPPAARARGFELATARAQRVFAWPNWADAVEIDFLWNAFGRQLVGRADVTLCVRRDPRLDPSAERVAELLARAHRRTLGEQAALDVLIVDEALDDRAWDELAQQVTCSIALRSSASGSRAVAYARLGRTVVHTIEEFAQRVAAQGAAQTSQYSRAVLDSVDWPVVEQIKALHPWYYPVVLGNLKVTPGVGSHVPAAALEHSTRCRATLLVDAVCREIDMRGKSVLELASNCGYWSSFYAQRGAARVVGLEGRDKYLEQARLYWRTNKFLPEDAVTFVQGNVADAQAWTRLRALGPFDVVLCAGILYHVPNYRDVLRWAAQGAREALIVDTRVDDGDEPLIEEPGELYFNAIAATRTKVVPNRRRLLDFLREIGFDPRVLPVGFACGPGVEDVDDYAAGRRVTILARRASRCEPGVSGRGTRG
jgi:2-polyprenyl-3-methyl-5-hydroxy-6-metoxy-1,4-benzoquinol methylase/GT2 family glycosyltransferase